MTKGTRSPKRTIQRRGREYWSVVEEDLRRLEVGRLRSVIEELHEEKRVRHCFGKESLANVADVSNDFALKKSVRLFGCRCSES